MSSTLLPTTMSTTAPEPLEKRRALRIRGGAPLRGEVTIGGAKNAALPLLAATLLTAEPCVLNNVPTLSDIRTMTELLAALGRGGRLRSRSPSGDGSGLDHPNDRRSARARRQDARFIPGGGPLLGRMGQMSASTPGGCQLGVRPVDVDVRGFRQMGATIEADEQFISAETQGPGVAWRVHLHGLSQPHRNREPAHGGDVGEWSHHHRQCLMRTGNRRAWATCSTAWARASPASAHRTS